LVLESIVLSGATAVAVAMKQGGGGEAQASSPFHVSGELALVSDYRRNGVTQSNGDPAIQGRFDIGHESGWSIGAFATSMQGRKGSNAQLVLFGVQRFEFGETDVSLGASAVFFFGGDADPFAVAQANISHPVGPIDATLSVSYAPPQQALNDEYGLNINLRARTPLGSINDAPLTAAASIGWSENEFAMGSGEKLDWSVGLTTEIAGTEFGLAYVDNDLDDDRGDAGLVFSIAYRF
jgi:uncharacterized protein (TIGR02001 family)